MVRRSTSLDGLKAVIGAGWDPATGGVDASGRNLHQRSVDAEESVSRALDADPGADPLGISRFQAGVNRINAAGAGGWSDWLQALKERAPGGVQTPTRRGDPMPGLSTAPIGQPDTFDPSFQTSAVSDLAGLSKKRKAK